MSDKSRYTTGTTARNFSINVTTTAADVVSNSTQSFSRSFIEIFNNGAADVYIWFKGSDPADARKVLPNTAVSYAVVDSVGIKCKTASGTATILCTEID